MTQEEYISQQMKKFAKNINEFSIGQTIKDKDKSQCQITNKTANSIEVFIKAKTEAGIDYKQWFNMDQFNDRFKA